MDRMRLGVSGHGRAKLPLSHQCAFERNTTFSGQPSTHFPTEAAAGFALVLMRVWGFHNIDFNSTTRFGWMPSAAQRAVLGGCSHSGGSAGASPSRDAVP